MNVLSHEYWLGAAKFREDYQQVYGSAPYVSKPTQWLWYVLSGVFGGNIMFCLVAARSRGSSTSLEEKDKALAEVQIHNAWFSEHILQRNTIMVVPRYDSRYRDEYLRYMQVERCYN